MKRASGPATDVSLPGRSAIIGAENTRRSNQRLPSWQARMPMAAPMEWPSAKIGGGQSGSTTCSMMAFEVGCVFGKIPHVPLEAIGERAVGQALPAPIERRHRKTARAQVAHGFEIFLDVFGAPLQHDHRALAPGRRRPAGKAQSDPVRGLDGAGHHVVGHRIGGNGDEFHEGQNEPGRAGLRLIVHDPEKWEPVFG